MKTKIQILLSLSFVLLFSGCANIQSGNDKLVVRAEQTRAAAFETFNSFVQFEYNNRAELWKTSKDIKHTADHIRAYGKPALEELTKGIDTYKLLKNKSSADTLNKNIALVTDLVTKTTVVYLKGKAALETINK